MIVILGESGSGKTTLVNNLISKHPELHKLVTYTTRPMREKEIDGVDYHFISKMKFIEMHLRGDFSETSNYNGWLYGTPRNTDDNTITILTPAGLRAIKRGGSKTLSIYLNVDRKSRLISALNRGDNIEEAYRRSLSDLGQFDSVEYEVDYCIDNECYKFDIDTLSNDVWKIIKGEIYE